MILQSLTEYYEALAAKGEIARSGWGKMRVSYALNINEQGELISIFPLKTPSEDGKKMLPREMELPSPVKRASNVKANFLCDNGTYFFGTDNKGKPDRAKQCFDAASELHTQLLYGVDSVFAKSICEYFQRWDVSAARESPMLAGYIDDMDKGANIVFVQNGVFAHQDAKIAQAWQLYYNEDEIGDKMRCLITGNLVVPTNIHPSIKGVRGAQSSGAALVSFNAPAYCSYDREQNVNAPVGKYASFAYTTALNYLIADRKHAKLIGDMTVVYWAEDADTECQDAFAAILDGESDTLSNEELDSMMKAIAQGKQADWNTVPINPDNRFYVLGLAPNAARLSVRFFLRDTFGSMVKNIIKHYEISEMVKDNRSKWKNIPIWALLRETVNENSRDKSPSPQMAGDTMRALLTGGLYPATLYQQTQLRIRAERIVTRGRASIIKAYLIRNVSRESSKLKEVTTVQLNENTTYQPYVLGRLFSVLEAVQERANPGINATIKDKYFSSACETPSIVFPIIIKLYEKHLKKMDMGARVFFSKQVGQLLGLITEDYPKHHSLYDQGIFQLGYYHQTQKRYEKKTEEKKTEEKEN